MNFIQIVWFVVLQACINCKLIYGFALIRHGHVYPFAHRNAVNISRDLADLLSPIGMRQLYNLGTFIREQYIQKQGFLPEKQDNTIEMFSSSLQRTQLSAYSFLFGLYPLHQGPKLQKNVNKSYLDPPFQPLSPKKMSTQPKRDHFSLRYGFSPAPVHSLDQIFQNCERIKILESNRLIQMSEKIQNLTNQYYLIIQKMKLIFNLPNNDANLDTMRPLYRELEADKMLGIQFPKAFTEEDQKTLRFIQEIQTIIRYSGKLGQILSTLPFQYITSKLLKAAEGDSNLKMSFMICHSSTLWPMMLNLNLTSQECVYQRRNENVSPDHNCEVPFYASNLFIELHQDDSTHDKFAKIKFNGKYMKMCASDQYECPLQAFLQRLKDKEQDYDRWCGPRPIKGYITQKV